MLLKISKVIENLMVVFVFVLIGCAPTIQFVVLRDVPENPSFVVLPANDRLSEAGYANRIERALIASGVKVVRRPALKEIKTVQPVGQARNARLPKTTVTSESSYELADIHVDYIVQTYRTSRQVKISKKETGEILTVLVVPEYDFDPDVLMPVQKQIISDTLLHMGILNIK